MMAKQVEAPTLVLWAISGVCEVQGVGICIGHSEVPNKGSLRDIFYAMLQEAGW